VIHPLPLKEQGMYDSNVPFSFLFYCFNHIFFRLKNEKSKNGWESLEKCKILG
jgi:hypothetical protein